MGFPPFWFLKNDVDIAYEFDQALAPGADWRAQRP